MSNSARYLITRLSDSVPAICSSFFDASSTSISPDKIWSYSPFAGPGTGLTSLNISLPFSIFSFSCCFLWIWSGEITSSTPASAGMGASTGPVAATGCSWSTGTGGAASWEYLYRTDAPSLKPSFLSWFAARKLTSDAVDCSLIFPTWISNLFKTCDISSYFSGST